jgi:hypothetical protein
MKFVFNDIFASDSNLFAKSEQLESVIVTSNLILENNVRIAQVTDSEFRDFIRKYKDGTATDRARIMREDFPKMDESQQKDFTRQIESRSGSSSSDPKEGDSFSERVLNQIIEDSEQTGVAGQSLNRKLIERNKIISRLRSSGFGPDEIARLIKDFDDADVPETLMLTLLEDALDYAGQGNASYKEVVTFMLTHYKEQLDADMTRSLTKLGSQIKAVSPDVPVFKMMIESAKGMVPDLELIPLIEDEEKRKALIEVLKLTQTRIVGQDEVIRREQQRVRDRLQKIQEQTNRQRALVDILQTIEVDKVLAKEINIFGEVFVKLMKAPMYRALRSILYDIAAARKILDAYGSLYMDTSPTTPRQTDREQRGRPEADSDLAEPNTGQGIFRRRESQNNQNIRIAQTASEISALVSQIGKITAGAIIDQKSDALSQFTNLSAQGKDRLNTFLETQASYWNSITNVSQIDNAETEILGLLRKKFIKTSSNNNFIKVAQIPTQTGITPVAIDENLEGLVKNYYRGFVWIFKTADAYSVVADGNFSGLVMLNKLTSGVSAGFAKELLLSKGIGGSAAPSQKGLYNQDGTMTAEGMRLLDNEAQVNAILTLTEDEQKTRINLVLKRKQNIRLVENTVKNLENDIKMTVDLGDGTGETPLSRPEEIKKKYSDFKKLLTEIIKQTQFEKDLLVRSFNRISKENLDPFKIKLIQTSVADIDKDLKFFQNEYGKISSTALIIAQISRKLRLLQKIGPIQKAIAKFKKAGLSTAALISSPNGFLRQLYLIRKEEEDALNILLEEYKKVSQVEKPVDLDSTIRQDLTTSTGEVSVPTPPTDLQPIREKNV